MSVYTLLGVCILTTSVYNFFFLSFFLSSFYCLQWRNVWAPCRWEPRWWNCEVAPRGWCGSSIWMSTSPASAGDLHARMKRPRVSFSVSVTVSREQNILSCWVLICSIDSWKTSLPKLSKSSKSPERLKVRLTLLWHKRTWQYCCWRLLYDLFQWFL